MVTIFEEDEFPPQLEDRYEPIALIRGGGYQGIFKATRKSDLETVVVKVRNLPEYDSDAIALQAEADLLSRLSHPGIVRFYRGGMEPMPHIEIEYIEGKDLDDLVCEDPLRKPLSDRIGREAAYRILSNTATALAYLHSNDLPHGDVGLMNIMVLPDYSVKLIDFEDLDPKCCLRIGDMHDPECPKISQDISRFGEVCIRLITGEMHDPILFKNRYQWLEQGHLINRCISNDRQARPSMYDVAQAFRQYQ